VEYIFNLIKPFPAGLTDSLGQQILFLGDHIFNL